MYEDKTYSSIMNDAMDEVDDSVQKSEGSLVYNALSALSYEIEKAYKQLNYIMEQCHAETADIDNLTAMAADRAVYRKMATHAIVKVVANVALSAGNRFSLKGYNYVIQGAIEGEALSYTAQVEETGSGANQLLGALTPIDYVEGLTTATVTEVLVLGEDDETRDSLYARYLASFTTESFSGNIAAYEQSINAFDGVGGCKVYPVWNGAGTVKCVVISSEYGAISAYLVNQIQEAAVPTEGGTGYGFAPIDHTVTIESVEEVTVDVSTTITLSNGYSWDSVKDEVETAIGNYFRSLAQSWGDGEADDFIRIYISRLESAVLDVPGVIDIQGTTLNEVGQNLDLDSDQIPVLGEVTRA